MTTEAARAVAATSANVAGDRGRLSGRGQTRHTRAAGERQRDRHEEGSSKAPSRIGVAVRPGFPT